ncbi:MAG TPA: SDR family oxidoreductase [Ktedonobacteraceae bacterium]|nr:SDR family oxidoreductase [Ktedonobacteraceae bacterium]
MQQRIDLQGKTILITGAGSGLGEACARAFAAEKCAVACLDINQDALERVCQELRAQGTPCLALPCDMKNAEDVFAAVQDAGEQFGHLDIVVNCAAIDYTCSVAEMSIEQWDREIAVNLRGPFLLTKAAWPWLQRQGGHIVNIASTAAVRAWANASAYHASKWGILGFSRGIGAEGRAYGIRVTTIIPGGMQTHFFDRFTEQGIPLPDPHNLQDPATVANSIVFATQVPSASAVQEMIITPLNETSWP